MTVTDTPKKRYNFFITQEQLTALEARGRVHDLTVSEQIRQAIDALLYGKQEPADESSDGV